jgi:hypothetical protein
MQAILQLYHCCNEIRFRLKCLAFFKEEPMQFFLEMLRAFSNKCKLYLLNQDCRTHQWPSLEVPGLIAHKYLAF